MTAVGIAEVCFFGKADTECRLPETMLREVPGMDSQHQDIINSGRIKFRLLLRAAAVSGVASSFPDHS